MQWQSLSHQAGLTDALPLTVVREHWLSGLESAGLQQRFFGGGVQFSTLMPMRAIPFKGVCLLGMNDGAYPRQSTPRDFDLMTNHWREGDRSRREDDRYLFLEAFLSAREKLYISWQGRRITDNQAMPSSVLVSQLRDLLQVRFAPKTDAPLQPLQAFSTKYFEPDSKFVTYADDWEQTRQSNRDVPSQGEAEPDPVSSDLKAPQQHVLPGCLLANDAGMPEWPLKECMRLLKQPVEVYWRSRLGVQLQGPEEALQDDENFSLQGLERYMLGRSLLEAADAEQQFEAEKIAGQLPMGATGQMVLKQQFDAAHRVNDRAAAYFEQYPRELPVQSVAVTVTMPWGDVRITADIDGLRQGENDILQISRRPGAVATGKRDQQTPRADVLLNLWPQHVLLCAASWPVRSAVVGLDGVALLPSLLPVVAQQILKQWLGAYVAAWQSPLPITLKAGLAYVSEQAKSQETDDAQNDAQQDAKNEAKNEAALDKASKAFSDSFSEDNDYSRSLYVQRSFESFEDIREGLTQWAPLLYASLVTTATMEGASA